MVCISVHHCSIIFLFADFSELYLILKESKPLCKVKWKKGVPLKTT